MLSHKEGWLPLLAIILCKIVLGIIIGYLAMWLYPKIFKGNSSHLISHSHTQEKEGHHHDHDEEDIHEEQETHEHIGCCKHDLESSKFDWKHPLLHCLKILLFILTINVIFGAIIEVVGEDKLTNFLSQSRTLQPILAVAIGLIPNCASSVVLTELYLLGGLSFGSVLAGLCVNAGLGLMVLFKQDKNIKEIAFILTMLIIPSLIAGYVIHFIV